MGEINACSWKSQNWTGAATSGRGKTNNCLQVFIEGFPGRRFPQSGRSPKWKALFLPVMASCHPRWRLTVSVDGSLAQYLQGLQSAWIPPKIKVSSLSSQHALTRPARAEWTVFPTTSNPYAFPRPRTLRKERLLQPFLEPLTFFPRTFSSAKWRHLVSGVATSRTSKSPGWKSGLS